MCSNTDECVKPEKVKLQIYSQYGSPNSSSMVKHLTSAAAQKEENDQTELILKILIAILKS